VLVATYVSVVVSLRHSPQQLSPLAHASPPDNGRNRSDSSEWSDVNILLWTAWHPNTVLAADLNMEEIERMFGKQKEDRKIEKIKL
jgi:hypothetical protein